MYAGVNILNDAFSTASSLRPQVKENSPASLPEEYIGRERARTRKIRVKYSSVLLHAMHDDPNVPTTQTNGRLSRALNSTIEQQISHSILDGAFPKYLFDF